MYVCVCLAVTDSEVASAIDNGAVTREQVTRMCGAGGDCGACHGMIEDMIEDRLEARADGAARIARCPQASDSGQQLIPGEALLRTVA